MRRRRQPSLPLLAVVSPRVPTLKAAMLARGVRVKRLGARVVRILLGVWFLHELAPQAFAHPPYEVHAGSFTRSDGVTISAFEHYVDGILGSDPVSVQFRLPDGTMVAQTERTRDSVIVRRTRTGMAVYRYPSDWIPIADSVMEFDGFKLAPAVSGRSRLLSPLVHTRTRWREYLLVAGAVAVWLAGWSLTRGNAHQGGWALGRMVVRVMLLLGCALAGVLGMFILEVSPFLALAVAGMVAAGWALLAPILSRWVRQERGVAGRGG